MARDNIIPLHRTVEVPVRTLDEVARLAAARPRGGNDSPPAAEVARRIEQRLRDDRPVHIEIAGDARPSTLERIADALGSPRMFIFYLGFYAGVMFCCASMIAWTVLQ